MNVAVGTDHGGYALKAQVIDAIVAAGHSVIDCGAYELDQADDYPDFAAAVALVVAGGRARRGVLICGSGVGASVAANKLPGIRAAVCHDSYSAHQGVEHDDMNVLVLGSRVVASKLAEDLVRAYIGAKFTHEERHVRRLGKIKALEAKFGSEFKP